MNGVKKNLPRTHCLRGCGDTMGGFYYESPLLPEIMRTLAALAKTFFGNRF